jgi:hypothetical protein
MNFSWLRRPPVLTLCVLLFVTIPYSHLLAKASKKSPSVSGFVLYYQPLLEFDSKHVSAYMDALRVELMEHSDPALNRLVTDPNPSPYCSKRKFKSCLFLIYQTKDCIPKKQTPSYFCFKKAKDFKKDSFKEPVFKRMEWNRWATAVNKHCLKLQSKTCHSLHRLRNYFMAKYQKKIRRIKKKRKKALKDPFSIKKIKKKNQ